jgi:hypothetical protein
VIMGVAKAAKGVKNGKSKRYFFIRLFFATSARG